MVRQILLDALLPTYNVSETHSIVVNRSLEETYATLKCVDFGESKIIVTLFKLRGLPWKKMDLESLISGCNFSHLGEEEPHEFVFGFVADRSIRAIHNVEEFLTTCSQMPLRVACNFKFEPVGLETTRVTTETRVECNGFFRAALFRAYWLVVRPFSGWIRQLMLGLIKEKAELVEI